MKKQHIQTKILVLSIIVCLICILNIRATDFEVIVFNMTNFRRVQLTSSISFHRVFELAFTMFFDIVIYKTLKS